MFLIHKMHYQYPENIIQLIYYTLYSLTLFSEDDMLALDRWVGTCGTKGLDVVPSYSGST